MVDNTVVHILFKNHIFESIELVCICFDFSFLISTFNYCLSFKALGYQQKQVCPLLWGTISCLYYAEIATPTSFLKEEVAESSFLLKRALIVSYSFANWFSYWQ